MFSDTSKIISLSTCFLLLVISKGFSFAIPMDSVGIEKEGNKTFILHKVDPKETLFSLSKRYNVKASEIEIENPELKQGLKIGQVLRIPYVQKSVANQTPGGRPKTHLVGQGQTLYSISKIYKVSVDDLKRWNKLTSNEVNIGQEIYVSAPPVIVNTDTPENTAHTESHPKDEVKHVPNFKYDAKGNKVHMTESGQTLFNISQIYGVSVDDLKKWNGLTGNEISTGQEIVVDKPKEKEVVLIKEKPADSIQRPVNVVTAPANTTQKNESDKLKDYAPATVKPSNSSNDFSKVTERGLAEVIDESGDNPKFLALHKSANIGTIIQVKNELNNLYIFARVIGRLPETGTNDKLIIKLSKKAYDKLGAVDRRFPVEVSYVPQ